MDEVSKVLAQDEKVIYKGKPNYKPYAFSSVIAIIIVSSIIGFFVNNLSDSLPLAVLVGVITLSSSIFFMNLAYKNTLYLITDKRLVIQSGVIGRDFKSIDYDRIQNVSVDVGILGVLFKVGTVKIFTGEMETISLGNNQSGMQSKYDTFSYIPNAYDVLKQLQTQLSLRKEKLA